MTEFIIGDVDAQLADLQRYEGRHIKRRWIKEGYTHQISFYGVLTGPAEGARYTPRIEVLSDAPWTEQSLMGLYHWFADLKPTWYYSIWLYRSRTGDVQVVWYYGRA